ncbi:MAG TPA: DUF4139 domain-containing protein [Burkholderiaceae bacterium]
MRIRYLTIAVACCFVSGICTAQPVTADETSVSAAARSSIAVTIYNDGQALVRDTRTLPLHAGHNKIAFRDVAASIRPETTSVRALSGTGFTLLEQNYEFDLLTPTALLNKYVGKEITVIHTNQATGGESVEKATVLSTNEGVVLRYADRIETGVSGRIAFGSVPTTLRDRPTLSLLLDSQRGGNQDVELMYLANQMSWKADYIANVNASGDRMQLNGWVTLTNQSGTAFENARLQLVAGTLNRVHEQRDIAMKSGIRLLAGAPASQPMQEEKLGDYHLYTLDRPTTILQNQTKQVALLSAAEIPVKREYVLQSNNMYWWWYQGSHPEIQKGLKPSVYLRFENKGGDLGIPLPAGTMRVYMKDANGGAQLVGEDAIAHTAKNEKIGLRLGEAFDITADRVQTDYKSLSSHASQSSYKIEIRNADSKPVVVTVREPLQGDWNITNETQSHLKESSGSAVWQVKVPADGKAVLEYTAVVKW